MKAISWRILTGIVLLCLFVYGQTVFADNLSIKMLSLAENYGEQSDELDLNGDGFVDLFDMVLLSKEMGSIDISRVYANYLSIISVQDKADFEILGMTFLTDEALIVTKAGIDLFNYVNAAEGMWLEITEGDNYFFIENDFLYLMNDMAPALTRVRIINEYAQSDEFYIYGTKDRELHDFTYDYLLRILKQQE